MAPADRAIASIIIVIDYKAGGSEAWDNLRLTLKGLTQQDYREPVEFLLVEADDGNRVPDDLQQILPGLRVVRSAGKTSYDFKNAGARAAASDFVVLLDADCVPRPGWWRALIEHHRQLQITRLAQMVALVRPAHRQAPAPRAGWRIAWHLDRHPGTLHRHEFDRIAVRDHGIAQPHGHIQRLDIEEDRLPLALLHLAGLEAICQMLATVRRCWPGWVKAM
jgi:Glycosyl transferase family 2